MTNCECINLDFVRTGLDRWMLKCYECGRSSDATELYLKLVKALETPRSEMKPRKRRRR